MKKNITFIFLTMASTALWFANYHLEQQYLSQIAWSFSILTGSYLIFKVILEDILSKKIVQKKNALYL